MNIGIILFIALIVLGIIMIFNQDTNTILGLDSETFGQAAFYALMAAFVSVGAFRGLKASQALRYIAIWVGLAVVLFAGYTYRFELKDIANRMTGELIPGFAVSTSQPGTALIKRSSGNHFHVRAIIDNAPIRLIFDTGASSVLLTAADAQKLGYDPDTLRYLHPVETANGRTFVANIMLDTITVGDITMNNVQAAIAKPGQLFQSLLGMSFLGRLSAYEVRGNTLIFMQ